VNVGRFPAFSAYHPIARAGRFSACFPIYARAGRFPAKK